MKNVIEDKSAAVVQDTGAYQRLFDIASRVDADEGIRQGLEDVKKRKDSPRRGIFRRVRSQAR
jgi:hypothetical protein